MPSLVSRLKGIGKFAWQALPNLRQVGTILPSPKSVARAMLDPVDWYGVRRVVETGAGNGFITEEIRRCMPDYARLTVYEVNPVFCEKLKETIKDKRVTIVNAGAETLDVPADIIFSSIPKAAFQLSDGRSSTLDAVVANLSPEGQFVHHQYIPFFGALKNYFGRVERRWAWCYLWPASVYFCSMPRSSSHTSNKPRSYDKIFK